MERRGTWHRDHSGCAQRVEPPPASRYASRMPERLDPENPSPSALGICAATWGAIGLGALLTFAAARLASVVVAGFETSWHWQHVAVAAANALFMAWSEGYRGFQRRFSPRSAARTKWLLHHPTALRALFAPAFVMGFFDAPRRRLIGVYALTAGIVAAIVLIHALPQPWRAAVDVGVVIGLAWGVVSFAWSLRVEFAAAGYHASPEVASELRR